MRKRWKQLDPNSPYFNGKTVVARAGDIIARVPIEAEELLRSKGIDWNIFFNENHLYDGDYCDAVSAFERAVSSFDRALSRKKGRMVKHITFNETTGQFEVSKFLCLASAHDPPYPRCNKQCKACSQLAWPTELNHVDAINVTFRKSADNQEH